MWKQTSEFGESLQDNEAVLSKCAAQVEDSLKSSHGLHKEKWNPTTMQFVEFWK